MMKGYRPTPGNRKYCDFRKQLLQYCKDSFEALLNQPLTEELKEDEKEEDRLEREFRVKHKLFGNIDFVGEIYKKGLLSESILNSVFHTLLGYNVESDSNVNDNTIDAGIKLINKLGFTLEQKVANASEEKRGSQQKMLDDLFGRFKELETMSLEDPKNKASLRVKLLIKNMFENKASKWEKTKNEDTQVKKKQEIANAVLKKAEEKKRMEMESRGGGRDYDDRRYEERGKGGRNDRGDRGAERGQKYVQKQQQSAQQEGGHGRGKKRFNEESQAQPELNRQRTGKGGKERDAKPRVQMSEAELQTKLKAYFSGYGKRGEEEGEAEEEIEEKPAARGPDFRELQEIMATAAIEERSVDIGDLLYHLLTAVFEMEEAFLRTHLPSVVEDVVAAALPAKSITRGVSRFLQEISDLATDVPHLPRILFDHVLKPLLDRKSLAFGQIAWANEDENELFSFAGHFKIFAMVLLARVESSKSEADALKWFEGEANL